VNPVPAVRPLRDTANEGIFATFAKSASLKRKSVAETSVPALLLSKAIVGLEDYVRARVLLVDHVLESLTDHVDALFDDRAYLERREEVRSYVQIGHIELVASAAPPDAFLNAAGPKNRAKIERIARLMRAEASILMQIMATFSVASEGSQAPVSAPPTPSRDDIFTNPAIPSSVRRGMLGSHRAEVAMLAFGASGDVSNHVRDALVDLWVENLFAHVRVMAAVPGITVSEDVLPLSERLNLVGDMVARTTVNQSSFRQLAEARKLGAEVFPDTPLDDDP
jgi:hypothetical protein